LGRYLFRPAGLDGGYVAGGNYRFIWGPEVVISGCYELMKMVRFRGCLVGMDSNISITNTQSMVGDTTLAVNNTSVSVSIPVYSVSDSNCYAYTQCYYSPSIPIVAEPSAADGFASIAPFLETAYGYKAEEGISGWTIYNPIWPSQMNSLKTLYLGRGYWIYVNQACIFQYGSNTYELDVGWNLIGWMRQS